MIRSHYFWIICLISQTFSSSSSKRNLENGKIYYKNQFAIQMNNGTKEDFLRLAYKYNMAFDGPIVQDYFLLVSLRYKKFAFRPKYWLNKRLQKEPKVIWAEQQIARLRISRFIIEQPSEPAAAATNGHRQSMFIPNDEHWNNLWFLHSHDRVAERSLKVEDAWKLGFTGNNVVAAIIDTGVERNHIELQDNYDSNASYDFVDNDYDPSPLPYHNHAHGTMGAGLVAAKGNNSFCVIGVAHNARIGGIRLVDKPASDVDEAKALTFNRQYIDIYSNSWGPLDKTVTFGRPQKFASIALREGTEQGRKGRGSIFIWASGNGGVHDNCNYDGYANSIYVTAISSVDNNSEVANYSESCSASLAVAYGYSGIMSASVNSTCTSRNGEGTSISAPLATGICALTLQANPMLTWRDMQYLIVFTSNISALNLSSNTLKVNGAGRNFNEFVGFGLMDALAMVTLAQHWTNVPEMEEDVYNGTKSVLLTKRKDDNSTKLEDWPLMTVHFWGEQPFGTWNLTIWNYNSHVITVETWSLWLYGTLTKVGPEGGIKHQVLEPLFAKIDHCCATDADNYCEGCTDNFVLYLDGCVKECPSQNYLEQLTSIGPRCSRNACYMCKPFCKICNNSESCSECIDNYNLVNDACIR